MIAQHFVNMFFSLSDTKGIKMVRAQCDKVSALTEYKDMSEPVFLFFLDGKEVGKVQGANVAEITKMVHKQAPNL